MHHKCYPLNLSEDVLCLKPITRTLCTLPGARVRWIQFHSCDCQPWLRSDRVQFRELEVVVASRDTLYSQNAKLRKRVEVSSFETEAESQVCCKDLPSLPTFERFQLPTS